MLHFKAQLLEWARQFQTVCYLDSNAYPSGAYHRYDCLIGIGSEAHLLIDKATSSSNAFDALKAFRQQQPGWLFGHFGYDLKNETEALHSHNEDGIAFPDLHFFSPLHVFQITGSEVHIQSKTISPATIFEAIQSITPPQSSIQKYPSQLYQKMSKAHYLEQINTIKKNIIDGDIYEMNFCQEFFTEPYFCDPFQLFSNLNALARAPYSCLYKFGSQYLLCASPERFLQKHGAQLISQPIKGTIRRGKNNKTDQSLRAQLARSEKDRAEHIMIVDLVRNDLARSCLPGSVQVEELFGIYTFAQVHHMISTISGTLRADIHFVDAIKNAFPMGSMTGAPKVMAMRLIEEYELSKRGLYSGAVGYITPEDDFDFNVVIRSMLYNAQRQYLSFQVGGAIVYDSIPEQEYEESLLKASAMLQILHAQIPKPQQLLIQ